MKTSRIDVATVWGIFTMLAAVAIALALKTEYCESLLNAGSLFFYMYYSYCIIFCMWSLSIILYYFLKAKYLGRRVKAAACCGFNSLFAV